MGSTSASDRGSAGKNEACQPGGPHARSRRGAEDYFESYCARFAGVWFGVGVIALTPPMIANSARITPPTKEAAPVVRGFMTAE